MSQICHCCGHKMVPTYRGENGQRVLVGYNCRRCKHWEAIDWENLAPKSKH